MIIALSSTGITTKADPIGLAGGLNRYVLGAKAIPWVARGSRDAFKMRAALKQKFRLGTNGPVEKLRPSPKYSDISDPLASAGKTNLNFNLGGIVGGGALAGGSILNSGTENCGCQ